MTANINIRQLDHSQPFTNKSIDTLVADIYSLFTDDKLDIRPERVADFGQRLGQHVANRISEQRGAPTLRLSNLGVPDRKLWYTVNTPESGEKLPPEARIKFLFGDILEELLLFLAKEAGHSVEGTQDTISVNGVVGHRDAVIDGRIVDVKSASSFSFKKFAAHDLKGNDPFGYIDQIGAYMAGSSKDPLVTEKDVGSFLVIDKTLGHITLDTYPNTGKDYDKVVDHKRAVLELPEPPERCYEPVPEGKSGNSKLCVQCSYCSFKNTCYPGLRTFIYSTGPTYLVDVVREPKVIEVDRNGEVVTKF
jgi:hypothetical protein